MIFLGGLRGLLSIVCLVPLVLVINFLQAISLFLPSKNLRRRFNIFLCRIWFDVLSFFVHRILGAATIATGDKIPLRENILLIANHQSMNDIPAVVEIARRSGNAQYMKWFLKDSLKWVPGIGWGLLMLDNLFVRRNWTADKERVLGTFHRLKESRMPFWIISYLEGTRLTPAKLRRSQEFARKQGMPHFENLLVPRTKGFTATLEAMRAEIQAVYIFTIAYEEQPPPSLVALFLGKIRRIHVHVRRFPISEIPPAESEQVQWIFERFKEKEALLARFRSQGRFTA